MRVIQFILNNKYLDYLTKEELDIVLEGARINLGDIAIKQLKELMKSMTNNYQKIKNLLDTLLFIDLKYNENIILRIFNELDENFSMEFAHLLILYLNYMEIIDYKIPYGKFFTYFENILDHINRNCPQINDIVKIIDSGFLSGAIPLDDKLSYGAVSY